MKLTLSILAAVVVAYLLGVWVKLDFDVTAWTDGDRGGVAFLALAIFAASRTILTSKAR